MPWVGTYTDEDAIVARLQGRLLFSSNSGQVGRIVPVIDDALFEEIANSTEAYVTSTLCALHYTTPLQLTADSTVNILKAAVSKQIISELFLSAPTVRASCTCIGEDENIDDILEAYGDSLSELCRGITDCKIKSAGETRDPDPCQAAKNAAKSSQNPGYAAVAAKRNQPVEPTNRMFGHSDPYIEDYRSRYL